MTRILNYVEFIKKESYNEFITVATAKPHRYTDAKNGTERSLEIAEYVLDTVQDAPATPAIPEKNDFASGGAVCQLATAIQRSLAVATVRHLEHSKNAHHNARMPENCGYHCTRISQVPN